MLNGSWIGITDNPTNFVTWIRKLRKNGDIPHEVSIARDTNQKEIKIYTDSGRCMRPLLVVGDHNELKIRKSDLYGNPTFEDLRKRGFVEFVDV